MNNGVVNLRQVRKQKARAEKRSFGDANAARHGQSKAQRAQIELEQAQAARQLDGHLRDAGEEPDDR